MTNLDEFCREFALVRSYSVPYAPPQNAQAERAWGILLRTTRILLAESGVSDQFWVYAIKHACTSYMMYYPTPRYRGRYLHAKR